MRGRRRGWCTAGCAIVSIAIWLSAGCRERSTERGEGAIVPDESPAERIVSSDPLWALAPSGLRFGVVVADGSGATLQNGLSAVVDVLERSLATEPLGHKLREQLTLAGLSLIDARLGDAGIDLARGAALFMGEGGPILVLPVADRTKLVAALGGTSEAGVDRLRDTLFCKIVVGRYACAIAAAQLDKLGHAGPSPVASWSSALRGHVEVYIAALPSELQDLLGPAGLVASQGIRIGARLERGAATIRMHVTGEVVEPLLAGSSSGRPRLAAGVDPAPSGLFVVKAAGLWRAFGERAVAELPAALLPGEVSLGELVSSVDGDAIGWAVPGEAGRAVVRIGLANETPMRKLLAACDEIGSGLPSTVKIARRGDRCAISIDAQLMGPRAPDARPFTVELWVDAGALQVDLEGHVNDPLAGPPARAALPIFAREILDDSPLFAAWGQGSFIGSQSIVSPADIKGMPESELLQPFLAMMYRVSELGVSLRVRTDGIHAAVRFRTLWANPDPLVAEIENVIEELSAGKPEAGARIAALVGRFPDSPFARDVRTGSGGLTIQLVPLAGLAGLSAWAAARQHEKRPWTAPLAGGPLGSEPAEDEAVLAPSGPVDAACAKIAKSLDAWKTGETIFRSRKSRPYWTWDTHQSLVPPTIDRGWREGNGRWLAVVIAEDGFRLDSPEPLASGDGPFPSIEIMTEALVEAARRDRRVVLVADGTQPATFARDLRRAVPAEIPVALAVRMPPSETMKRFAADVRGRIPPEAARAMELSLKAVKEESWAPLGTGIRLAVEYAGECTPGVRRAMNKLRQGGGIDVIGPELAAAFRACNCRAADVDGVVTAAAFVAAGVVGRGWIPIWGRDDGRWILVRQGANLEELAELLMSSKAPARSSP